MDLQEQSQNRATLMLWLYLCVFKPADMSFLASDLIKATPARQRQDTMSLRVTKKKGCKSETEQNVNE